MECALLPYRRARFLTLSGAGCQNSDVPLSTFSPMPYLHVCPWARGEYQRLFICTKIRDEESIREAMSTGTPRERFLTAMAAPTGLSGSRFETGIPTRDGIELAADVYLPTEDQH